MNLSECLVTDFLLAVDAVAMAINSPEPEPVAEVADKEEGESLHESEAVSHQSSVISHQTLS